MSFAPGGSAPTKPLAPAHRSLQQRLTRMSARWWSWHPSVLRAGGAAAAGGLLYLSFPPRALWWFAAVGFAVLGLVLRHRRARAGFGYGLLAGLGFFVPLLAWTGEFVGPWPWLVLAAVQALFVAAAGAGIAAVSRLPGWPVWAGAVWVAEEAVRARVPFGGFPWGKVAFGQTDGVFLPLVAVGGTPLVAFAVTVTGFGLAALIGAVCDPATNLRWTTAAYVLLPTLAGLAATTLPVGGPEEERVVMIAAVQGNVPRLGLDFNAQRRAVLDNHVRRTEQLAADVDAGRVARPDLVIWPENSADIDPLRNPDARAAIDRAASAIDAPILVGAVLTPPDGPPTNTMIVWSPTVGPGQEHDKRRLQPFGEYVPFRELLRRVTPLVDRSGNFAPGSGDGVVDLGGVRVGVATCYEVIFDDLVRQSVDAGAELLAVPSNNATFGLTDMTYQQLAIDQVRAVEHDRTVVVAATSGVSAIIAPDGRVLARSGQFTADALVTQVPLRSTSTPARTLGGPFEWLLAGIGAGAGLTTTRTACAGRWRRDRP